MNSQTFEKLFSSSFQMNFFCYKWVFISVPSPFALQRIFFLPNFFISFLDFNIVEPVELYFFRYLYLYMILFQWIYINVIYGLFLQRWIEFATLFFIIIIIVIVSLFHSVSFLYMHFTCVKMEIILLWMQGIYSQNHSLI